MGLNVGNKVVNTVTGSFGEVVAWNATSETYDFDWGHGVVSLTAEKVEELLLGGDFRVARLATTGTVHAYFYCNVHKRGLKGEPNWFPMKGNDEEWVIDFGGGEPLYCPTGDDEYEDAMEADPENAEYKCREDPGSWVTILCIEE